MAKLTLKQLVQITPFTEDVKKRALEKLPQMNETQQFDFEQICWETIHDVIGVRVNTRFEEELKKIAEKQSEEPINVDIIQTEVISEFLKKMDSVMTEEEMQEVQESLKQKPISDEIQQPTDTSPQAQPAENPTPPQPPTTEQNQNS